jgi:aminopeptidase YwaD
MSNDDFCRKAEAYLKKLCGVRPHRRLGSPGNHQATEFFAGTIGRWGYEIDAAPFKCLDHVIRKSSLMCVRRRFEAFASPYSPGCDVEAELAVVGDVEQLEACNRRGRVLLLHGEITAEQLMPKNFVFYNPDHHKKIYGLLEKKQPAAIITATEKKPELVGAIYPFPMIEDGDFDIPSMYCRETVGADLAEHAGEVVRVFIDAKRIPSTGCNVIAWKNRPAKKKIVISAHIDARETTPGASDNASGVVVLLLLAEMLKDYAGGMGVEIAALNGEDHYSVAGQMDYLRRFEKEFERTAVAVNIDDVGYRKGKTAYSMYECQAHLKRKLGATLGQRRGIMEGPIWYQGDHMMFVQSGVAAVALTAEKAAELMKTVTHTEKDTPDLIDCRKLVELAGALRDFVVQG